MKRWIIICLIVVGIVAVAYVVYDAEAQRALSSGQQEIVGLFGYPSQFSIEYLPQGGDGEDADRLVRHELWMYPEHVQAIRFLGGEIVEVMDITGGADATAVYSDIRPDQVGFAMTYDDVAALFPDEDIEPIDAIPGLFEEGEVETYVSENAFFTIEHGQLVYFETVGIELEDS